jgi:hypothetical protein
VILAAAVNLAAGPATVRCYSRTLIAGRRPIQGGALVEMAATPASPPRATAAGAAAEHPESWLVSPAAAHSVAAAWKRSPPGGRRVLGERRAREAVHSSRMGGEEGLWRRQEEAGRRRRTRHYKMSLEGARMRGLAGAAITTHYVQVLAGGSTAWREQQRASARVVAQQAPGTDLGRFKPPNEAVRLIAILAGPAEDTDSDEDGDDEHDDEVVAGGALHRHHGNYNSSGAAAAAAAAAKSTSLGGDSRPPAQLISPPERWADSPVGRSALQEQHAGEEGLHSSMARIKVYASPRDDATQLH